VSEPAKKGDPPTDLRFELTRETLARAVRDMEPVSMRCSRCRMNIKIANVGSCETCGMAVCKQCAMFGYHKCPEVLSEH
jgi:rRNA maturation endonuclease Nob1